MSEHLRRLPGRGNARGRASLRAAIAAALALALCAPTLAQDQEEVPPPPKLTPVPDAVEPPPKVQSGEVLEPEVRIFRRAGERITEYRINGRLRAIRVEPDVGPAYYLIDHDGDGRLETRGHGPDFVVPQ